MNNIPKGYKQTEVGVIPEDWEVDKIKNLAHITTGSKIRRIGLIPENIHFLSVPRQLKELTVIRLMVRLY